MSKKVFGVLFVCLVIIIAIVVAIVASKATAGDEEFPFCCKDLKTKLTRSQVKIYPKVFWALES